MTRFSLKNQRAFSLMEIIAAIGIVMVIFIGISQLTRFYRSQSDDADARGRMEKIVDAARAYYLDHENLPIISRSLINPLIPIEPLRILRPTDPLLPSVDRWFDIDPKNRFDGWGKDLLYISYSNDGVDGRPGEILIDPLESGAPVGAPVAMVVIPEGSRTLLRAIEFEGRRVAGLIISAGPDQVFGYTVTPGYPEVYELDPVLDPAASDDIIVPIDLNAEAIKIALSELKALNEKVTAFDDRYLGVDNNNETPPRYDEQGCQGILYGVDALDPFPPGWDECSDIRRGLPADNIPPGTTDDQDINCGRPTLDYMKAFFCAYPWGEPNCPPGYYVPEIPFIPPTPIPTTDPDYDPLNPGELCNGTPRPQTPADYARIPFDQGNPQPEDCHWGLVETQYGDAVTPEPNETDGDQARAFIYCLFNLSPDDIVDPWLNGYVWGCGSGPGTILNPETQGGNPLDDYYDEGCQYYYENTDPHYRRFFSAGSDGFPALLEAQIETTPEAQAATDDIVN